MKYIAIFLIILSGCHTGDFSEDCNKDGTCNSENLICSEFGTCQVKPTITSSHPRFEADSFCITCAERCGSLGMKSCVYSDTSVWGAKPSVCECNQK